MLATRRRHSRLPSDGVFSTRSTTNSKFSTFRTNKIPVGMTGKHTRYYDIFGDSNFFFPSHRTPSHRESTALGLQTNRSFFTHDSEIAHTKRRVDKGRLDVWKHDVWFEVCCVARRTKSSVLRILCLRVNIVNWNQCSEKKKCRSTLTILKKKKRACRVNRCTSCYRRGLPNTSSNSTQKYYPKLTDVS